MLGVKRPASGVEPENWQGRQDSNPRPMVLETIALPTELHPCGNLKVTRHDAGRLCAELQSSYRMELMRVPVSAFLLSSLLGALVLGGCKQQPPSGIKMVRPVQTAVSLCPDAAELLMLASVRTIGRSASDNYPPSVAGLPIVCNIKPDYEKIAELKPDAIVFDPSLFTPDDIQKLKALNIPLAPIEGNTVDEFIKCLYRLGQTTQSETAYMDYIDRLEKAVKACSSDPIQAHPKVAVMMTSKNANPMIAGTGSFYDDLVRVAGGEPVGPSTDKFQPINAEALLALNPDAIVVAAPKGAPDGLTDDPRFAQLKAVKNRKVMVVEQDYLVRRGERVDVVIDKLHDALIKLFK